MFDNFRDVITSVQHEHYVRCNLSNMSKRQSEKINMCNHQGTLFLPHIRQKCQKNILEIHN